MADVLVDTADLTVLGGPQELIVQTNIGSPGVRGSIIYGVSGVPNNSGNLSGKDVVAGDWAINYSQENVQYGYMYRYTGVEWETYLPIIPYKYSTTLTATFDSSGVARINSISASFVPGATDATDQSGVTISYSIENSNPIASSITVPTSFATVQSDRKIDFSINASELSGSTWSPLTGDKKIHVFIDRKYGA